MRKECVVTLLLWCLCHVVYAQSARVLTGRVLDAQGNPVAGAQVYYYPNLVIAWMGGSTENLPTVTTDEHGRYRLTGAAISASPFSCVVAFHPQKGCSTVDPWKRPLRELRLLPLQEFTGKVVDTQGRPVAGAKVRLTYVSLGGEDVILAPPMPPFVTATDTEGAFRLPAHPQMQALMLFVNASGYEPLMYSSNITWERASKEGLKLTLKPGARITAQLVYAHSGEPARGYPVLAAEPPVFAVTDEEGRLALDVGAGSVTLMPGFSLSSPNLAPPGSFARVQVKELEPGTTTDLGVIKVYTEPVVTVEVRDDNRRPVPFCAVEISPAAERGGRFLSVPYFTDAKGQLRLPLADGEYTLTASKPAENAFYTSREAQQVTVRDGKVAVAQPIVLQVTAEPIGRQQSVKMQVRTSRNHIPKQVWVQYGAVTFEAFQELTPQWRPYRMDGDILTVEMSLIGAQKVDRLFILDAGTGEGAVLRNLNVSNPPKRVRLQPLPRVHGRVLDASGKPVAGAKVRIVFGRDATLPGGTGSVWVEVVTPLSTSTSETGKFALPVVSGVRCWAIVTALGYEPAAVVVERGKSVTIRLRGAKGEYAGVLVDEYGEPVAKARIDLRYTFPGSQARQNREQRRLPTQEIPLGSFTTDEAGRFALKAMPSTLLLVPRIADRQWTRIRAKPSRELVLVHSAPRAPWERESEPAAPNVERLLRAVEWLQPVQWQGKNSLLVFTAPYLPGNETTLQAVQRQRSEGWQIAVVLDTTSRAEAESLRRQMNMDIAVGYWKKSPTHPKPPSLPQIVPGLPYVVHLGEDGKAKQMGIAGEDLPKWFGALPPR
ncbi:MAG: carboxypeptidase-like regulatory domain-containing protein [bacterium]|nr:carboxypeptidase-like regulatory domain-containing protein [bacterium]